MFSTVLKKLLLISCSSATYRMAPKIRKDDTKSTEGKPFESVLIVCPKCREVKEIVQAKRGKMNFIEYYCCPGRALEIHSASNRTEGDE